jgi:hypothetical protein
MTRLLALVAATALLAGCGMQPATTAAKAQLGAMTAQKKAAKLDPKLDKGSYDAGLAVGIAKAQGKTATPKLKQGSVDKLSFDYGYAVGLLTGSINSFNRINGSFGVSEWKSFTYMNFEAMKEAREALESNGELASKVPVAVGILAGGIASFSSINGSFDVQQWRSFAYTNKTILENALNSLKSAAL